MDNTPDEVKGRVTAVVKAIRYKARKEGGNLVKAFNDYMGSASGVSSSDRQLIKQKLGLSESISDWRHDLREVMTDKEDNKEIKEKKVKNKIKINPAMGEAFEKIGGTILEVTEVSEADMTGAPSIKDAKPAKKTNVKKYKGLGYAPTIKEQEVGNNKPTPEQKKQLQNKTQMMRKQQMLQRQRLQMQKQGKLPMGHSEGYAPGDVDQKVGAVTAIPKKEQDAARERLLAKAKAKRAKLKEGYNHSNWRDDFRAFEIDSFDLIKPDPLQPTKGLGSDALEEKLNMKKAEMGEVIDDFYKSDAPQFKGKSKEKRREMAIAAKLNAEETEDSLRDRRMERGGVDGNVDYRRPPKAPNTKKFGKGQTPLQKEMEKKYGKGATAMDIVRKQIEAKHGKGAIMDTKKKGN